LFCKPIAKRPHDRDALQNVALKAHPKVMFGSDSAPHPQHAKESCGCAAGVFTAPIALAKLAEIFMAKSMNKTCKNLFQTMQEQFMA
jgi:dihydroorotase